uniref:phasin family protein n=1 Tax=Oceanobacillus massiliensis TaxID=1465765 RepID=UPI003016A31C
WAGAHWSVSVFTELVFHEPLQTDPIQKVRGVLNMSDYLKRGFLLGLGAAVNGKEKLDQKLKELVDKNELSKEQAKTVMQNYIEKGSMKKDEWNAKQYEQTQKMAKEYGVATKEDINELRARITVLEDKLNEQIDHQPN